MAISLEASSLPRLNRGLRAKNTLNKLKENWRSTAAEFGVGAVTGIIVKGSLRWGCEGALQCTSTSNPLLAACIGAAGGAAVAASKEYFIKQRTEKNYVTTQDNHPFVRLLHSEINYIASLDKRTLGKAALRGAAFGALGGLTGPLLGELIASNTDKLSWVSNIAENLKDRALGVVENIVKLIPATQAYAEPVLPPGPTPTPTPTPEPTPTPIPESEKTSILSSFRGAISVYDVESNTITDLTVETPVVEPVIEPVIALVPVENPPAIEQLASPLSTEPPQIGAAPIAATINPEPVEPLIPEEQSAVAVKPMEQPKILSFEERLIGQPVELELAPGSTPWETAREYLRVTLGREPTQLEIMAVTKELCAQSGIAVDEWGLKKGVNQRLLRPGYKLIFNQSVKDIVLKQAA